MSEKIDLDALAGAEIGRQIADAAVNAGIASSVNDSEKLIRMSNKVESLMDELKRRDAIRRHVAPAPGAPDAGLRDSDAVILQVAKTLYNTFDDPYERDQAFDDLPDRTRHFYVDTAREIAAIIAILPAPRVDGEAVEKLLTEFGMAQYDIGQFNVRKDGRKHLEGAVARSDAARAKLRALLGDGREGNDA